MYCRCGFYLAAALVCLAALLSTAHAQLTQVFGPTDPWKYDFACHDVDNWQTTIYDDSSWSSGPGGFTGGENTPATLTLLTGLLNTTSLPAPFTLFPAGHAMYFRKHFNIADIGGVSLVFSNGIDDGATFYLNGTQVLNLRVTSPGMCGSFSGGAIGANTDTKLWEVTTLTSNALAGIIVNGDNVLAVEVHQVNATSSDMVFIMALMSQTTVPPTPPPILWTNGTGVITFDTAPPLEQWSTRLWSGGHGDVFDIPSVDAAAKTNDASLINVALDNIAGNPPAANNQGVYASDAGAMYIQTRPTGNAYSGIMATLSNATASAVRGMRITYDLTVAAPMPEQVNGHLVYYSTSGTPNSWVQIPDLNDQVNDNTAGTYAKSATIDLSGTPWGAHTKMYFLWVDDNADPSSPDTALEIDNVQFSSSVPMAPLFANTTDPTNRTVAQCSSTTLSTVASGVPNPTYQWFKNDLAHPVDGATNSFCTIASMSSTDAGNYFLQAMNASGTAYSHTGRVTYVAAPPFAAVSTLGTTNPSTIVMSFNLPVAPVTLDSFPGFQFTVQLRGQPGVADLYVNTSTVINGTDILLNTDPRADGANYEVVISEGISNTCTGTTLSGTFSVASQIYLVRIDGRWQYNQSGVDPGPSWLNNGYDDTAAPWQTGQAIFDGKTDGPRATLNGQKIHTTLQIFNGTTYVQAINDIPTYYFRTHFNFPGSTEGASLVLRPFIDDACIIYLNGQKAVQVGFTNDPPALPFTSYGGPPFATSRTVLDAKFDTSPYATPGGYTNLALTNVVVGDNVIAVELKQERNSSSDADMGLELTAIVPAFPPKLSLTPTSQGQFNLMWGSGVLQQRSSLTTGQWADVLDGNMNPVPSGYPVDAASLGGTMFYRLR